MGFAPRGCIAVYWKVRRGMQLMYSEIVQKLTV